jgi:hypothetical protein
MEIESQESDGFALRLTEEEIGQWNNALNEVCNGFAVANFDATVGISEEAAATFLARVHSLHPKQPQFFSLDELLAVRNALTMVLGELHPAEFCTRMGFTVEEAGQMRNTLDLLTGRLQLHKTA